MSYVLRTIAVFFLFVAAAAFDTGHIFAGGAVCFLAGCLTMTVVVDLSEEK